MGPAGLAGLWARIWLCLLGFSWQLGAEIPASLSAAKRAGEGSWQHHTICSQGEEGWREVRAPSRVPINGALTSSCPVPCKVCPSPWVCLYGNGWIQVLELILSWLHSR